MNRSHQISWLGALLVLSIVGGIISVNYTETASEKAASLVVNVLIHGHFASHHVQPDGVPVVRYPRMEGLHPNPVYAGMYALKYYSKWQANGKYDHFLDYYKIYLPEGASGDAVWRNRFLAIANWYVSTIEMRQYNSRKYGVWDYDFPWKHYRLRAGWVSGMAQGIAIQVLQRAWQITGNAEYLRTMELAAEALFVPVNAGGVTRFDSERAWWYEEYAAPYAVESRVLNGHEHVVIALHEAYEATNDSTYAILFERGMLALEHHIRDYAAPKERWTYYDALGTLAKRKYHRINIYLTRQIGVIASSSILLQEAAKWHEYEQGIIKREFERRPISEKFVLMVLLNIAAIFIALLSTSVSVVMLSSRKKESK